MADQNIQEAMKNRFAELPAPVQKAITSTDIQKRLRELADEHKLHLDQWEILENEVLMALFGITPVDELQSAIQKEVGVSAEVAAVLAADVSRVVFEPIRQELERELEHPEAKEKEVSGVDATRTQVLSAQQTVNSEQRKEETTPVLQPVPVVPATPPPPPPTEKAIRMPASGAYVPGETSVARKDIHDDPYRESPA
ncbi:hypothetical protein A3A40_02190 [Candidatus Kaiserbacteria bacterium RIFCSPLOWO2_01_FULL_54_20]|uniref:Uncharacterized protein n=1 Tax=Candidatus Kaiserbacteria bacterium RIFCSPLOWO2_01_FULL_54_20 TaxID=1798513 RepID=A0A1F6EKL5_9BACT|nr:MAG: hypothetical protein A3A40_02190 [Candidatus Kaiserbacteria bacterium RIFCSPLOWO2_01_FULL_54_20]